MKRFSLSFFAAAAMLMLVGCAGKTTEAFKYDRARLGQIRRLAVMGFVGEVKRDKSRIAIRQIFQEKLADFRRFYIVPDDSVRQAVIDFGIQEMPYGYNIYEIRRVARKLRADAVVYGENYSSLATAEQGKYILGGKDLLPHFHAALITSDGKVIWKAWAEGEAGKETQLKKTLTLGLLGEDEQVREAISNTLTVLADYLVRGELPSGIDTHPHVR
jgi:hypothetical protein